MASDTSADERTDRGVVAQLGEHLHGMQGVGGSSPPSSTPHPPPVVEIGAHEFRNLFGHFMERAAAGEEIRVSRHGRPYVRLVAAEPRGGELLAPAA